MRSLFLIRHGKTAWNSAGRVQGHSDIPLSDEGVAEALALRAYPFDARAKDRVVFSSPLERAATTAALAFPGATICLDERLKELNYGAFEGLTLAERETLPTWQRWTSDAFDHPTPDGESLAAVQARALAWLEALPDAPHIVALSHSGTIQVLLAHVLELETRPWRKRMLLAHTGVSRLLETRHGWMVEYVNDVYHLRAERLLEAATPRAHPNPQRRR